MSWLLYFRWGYFEHLAFHLLGLSFQPLNYLGIEQNANILPYFISIYPLWKASKVNANDRISAGSSLDDGRTGLSFFSVNFVVNLFILGFYLQDEFFANLPELSYWHPCVIFYQYLWLFWRIAKNSYYILPFFNVSELVQGKEGMGKHFFW